MSSLRRVGTLTTLSAIVALSTSAAHGDPLLTRNQSPLLVPYGLPGPLPARVPAAGGGRAAAALNWANAARVDETGPYVFTLDGEVQELRIRLEHSLGTRFATIVELPWRHLNGGSLDGFVEDWHAALGLPRGSSRRQLPRDELLIEYRENGLPLLRVDASNSGLADVPISVGCQIGASDRRALGGWLTVKVPVGEADELRGSGAADVALSLSGEARLADAWQLFGQIDSVWLGQGDILPRFQESFVWSALAGLSWNAWRTLDLTTQLSANSSVYGDAATDLGRDAVVLSFGGSYRTAGGWRFDLGMSEDIVVGASPDASFNFAVRHDF